MSDEEALALIEKSQNTMKEDSEVALYDKFGQRLIATKSNERQIEIDLSDIPEGIYLLRIEEGSKTVSQRIVVDK